MSTAFSIANPFKSFSKSERKSEKTAQKPYRSVSTAVLFASALCLTTVLLNGLVAVLDGVSPLAAIPAVISFKAACPSWIIDAMFDSAWFLAYALPAVLSFVLYRLYQNLPALGAEKLEFSPGQAVKAFYVPVANFHRPTKVAAELLRNSQVSAADSRLLCVWGHSWKVVWLAIIAYFLPELVSLLPGFAKYYTTIYNVLWIPIQIGFAYFLLTTLVGINVVQEQQDMRWESVLQLTARHTTKLTSSMSHKKDLILIAMFLLVGGTETFLCNPQLQSLTANATIEARVHALSAVQQMFGEDHKLAVWLMHDLLNASVRNNNSNGVKIALHQLIWVNEDVSKSYWQLGNVAVRENEINRATDNYKLAIAYANQSGKDDEYVCFAHCTIANLSLQRTCPNYEEILAHYKRALQLKGNAHLHQDEIAWLTERIAAVCQKLGRNEETVKYLKEAATLRTALGHKKALKINQNQLAQIQKSE